MELEAKLEFPNILPDSKQTNHLLIRIKSPQNPTETHRQPLVLGIAIDKSWSMKGEKMESVLEASSALVNWLTRHDWISIIAYSSDVQIIQPLVNVIEKVAITDKIRSIEVATATNLSGGWLSALHAVETSNVENAFKRVILLTDGNPTIGVKDSALLNQIAKDHLARGISTTVIGVGGDFNESILADIAKAGGGNFYFVDNPDSAADIFFEEFGELGALYAQAIELNLDFAPGITVSDVLNDLPFQISESTTQFAGNSSFNSAQTVKVQIGDMRSDDLQSIVMRVEVDSRSFSPKQDLLKANVGFYNLQDSMHFEKTEMKFQPEFGNDPGIQDPDVLVELLIAKAHRALKAVSLLIQSKNTEEANSILFGVIQELQKSKNHAPSAIGAILSRLEIAQSKIKDKSDFLSKHILAASSDLSRNVQIIDTKGLNLHNRIYEYHTKGDIDLYKCPELRLDVEKKLDEGFRFMIFNLSETAYMDSSAIGTLIQIVGWLRKRGGEFVAINLKDSVRKVFEVTRLYNHIRIAESRDHAQTLLEKLIFASEGTD